MRMMAAGRRALFALGKEVAFEFNPRCMDAHGPLMYGVD